MSSLVTTDLLELPPWSFRSRYRWHPNMLPDRRGHFGRPKKVGGGTGSVNSLRKTSSQLTPAESLRAAFDHWDGVKIIIDDNRCSPYEAQGVRTFVIPHEVLIQGGRQKREFLGEVFTLCIYPRDHNTYKFIGTKATLINTSTDERQTVEIGEHTRDGNWHLVLFTNLEHGEYRLEFQDPK